MPAGSAAEEPLICSPVLAALRSATASQHRQIESLLPLGGELSLASYIQVVRGFDAFLSAWEPRVAAALPERLRPWLAQRSRHPLARRDLHKLGAPRVTASHHCLQGLHLTGTAAAFGSLYVIEGSALGGQVIAPRLARQLDLHADSGAAYFAGWGPRTGAMWREFRQKLEQEVGGSEPSRAQACRAATQTFEALGDTFREVLHDGVIA
jgi:heme oxygenase (biliverdin-IX-beta and delta-forming)